MAASSGLREDELAEIAFNDENFIRMFGLHVNNALDYFALSPWYDHTSNNELVRMQKLGLEVLQTMKGIEYRLLHTGHEPVLFVVVKQERASQTIVRQQAIYYILDKTIYQAPTLQRLVVSRLVKTAAHLQNAFEKLNSAMRYAPSQGFTWHFEGDVDKSWRQSSEGLAFERRRKRRDERPERRGEAEISGILKTILHDFVPKDQHGLGGVGAVVPGAATVGGSGSAAPALGTNATPAAGGGQTPASGGLATPALQTPAIHNTPAPAPPP